MLSLWSSGRGPDRCGKRTLLASDRVLLFRGPIASRGTTLRSSRLVAAAGRRRLGLAACLLVAVTAFVVRLAMVLRGGGLGGLMGYDDGVYYSASSALWWGRLPYRDFVLVHPPGMLLALAPFAGLGRLTHDALGFQLARLAWMLVGSLNAALVVCATRRSGPVAATAAGLAYTMWTPAAMTETTTRLEPLVSLGLLVAVTALSGGRPATRRGQWLAGGALGFAMTVKVWAVAPALVVLLWLLVTGGRRAAVRAAAAAALTVTLVCLPFWLLAPSGMFRMVVLDQLGRGRTWAGTGVRLVSALGLRSPHGHYWWPLVAWCLAAAVVGAVVLVGSVGSSRGRLAIALLVVQLGVLLASPSYFSYYAAFLAPALALLVAGGVAWTRRLRARPRSGRSVQAVGTLLVAGALAAVAAVGTVAATARVGKPFPAQDVARTVASSRCVTADSPDVLILTDVLQRDWHRGCRVLVDLSGLSYDGDALPLRPDGTPVARALNPSWQRDLTGYLFSGDAMFLTRPASDGFSPESLQRLDALPVLRRGRGFVLLTVR
jgi:alpha-1,2-mannosyltransferase